jgi:hypothetical protein
VAYLAPPSETFFLEMAEASPDVRACADQAANPSGLHQAFGQNFYPDHLDRYRRAHQVHWDVVYADDCHPDHLGLAGASADQVAVHFVAAGYRELFLAPVRDYPCELAWADAPVAQADPRVMAVPASPTASLLVRLVVADEPLAEDVRQVAEKLLFRVGARKTVGPGQRGVDPVAALQERLDEVLARLAAQMEKQKAAPLALEVLEPVRSEQWKRVPQLTAVQTVWQPGEQRRAPQTSQVRALEDEPQAVQRRPKVLQRLERVQQAARASPQLVERAQRKPLVRADVAPILPQLPSLHAQIPRVLPRRLRISGARAPFPQLPR